MGSFNKIGFQSGIPIVDGTDIVLFICSCRHDVGLDNSPVSTESLLSPICLPLHGTYNSYGSIDNIQRDANVILIEEKFGDSVEKLLEVIHEYNGASINDLLLINKESEDKSLLTKLIDFLISIKLDEKHLIYTTMEHRDIYFSLIDTFNKPFITNNKWSKGANIGDFWLSKLGFKKANNEHESSYILPNCDYYVMSRGYTPPKIMLGTKEVWYGYGGLTEFITQFNKIANTNIALDTEYLDYSSIDASFHILRENYKKNRLEELKVVSPERVAELNEKFKDSPDMLDYINNKMGHFNIFIDDFSIKCNDIVGLHRQGELINKSHMCLYNDINILSDDYRIIATQYLKFNRSLRMMCSSYRLSSYAFQSINDYKDEFKAVYQSYLNKIDYLTPIND